MFFQPSEARETLRQWLTEILPHLRPDNADARLLDEITAAEILDLAYLQGTPLGNAIVAHALFPVYAEERSRTAAPSTMMAEYVVSPTGDGDPTVQLVLRCASPSELKIGQGGRPRVTTPRGHLPPKLLAPEIKGSRYEMVEAGGERLRALAGPIAHVEERFDVRLVDAEGSIDETVVSTAAATLFGYVDAEDELHVDFDGIDSLGGGPVTENSLRTLKTYLWAESRRIELRVMLRWRRLSVTSIRLRIAVRNVTQPLPAEQAKDTLLGTVVLPHTIMSFQNAEPAFPNFQYAETKRQFLAIEDEEQRLEVARERLYAVSQSACVATRSTVADATVLMTTFGVYDTPRETPIRGPATAEVTADIDGFLANCPDPSDALIAWVGENWEILQAILMAAAEAFEIEYLHAFQWEAIVTNVEMVANNENGAVTVVRAPTGAGKTIVFFVDAAISSLCGGSRSTSVLMFPTRLLNEDMFRRLLSFVAHLRTKPATFDASGGILMGTSDPLYRVLLEPEVGEEMTHFGRCPECGNEPMVAQQERGRIVPTCPQCGHLVDYMYDPKEVASFLPDVVIATPDKLMFECTASKWLHYSLGLFGAPVRRCDHCGRVCPEALYQLKREYRNCSGFHRSHGCSGEFRGPATSKLIHYMGFDEVHSLYGQTATYLSIFLADLGILQATLARERRVDIRYETATATIANEIELLEALTRRRFSNGEITLIPPLDARDGYFEIDESSVRHRALVTLPTKVSSRQAFIQAVLNAYLHLRAPNRDLVDILAAHTGRPDDWGFLLGYVFKKQEGSDLRRALRDMYRNAFAQDLKIEFLSGDAPKDRISRTMQRAAAGDIDVLLANLVISLGIDIHGLNHMIMLGVPRGFTEYVQTAGRTGRGDSPGHVQIVLQPNNPRDAYLYRHFHAIFSDVAGYYDLFPVKSTNLFCATESFGNVAYSLLNALCMNPQRPRWAHNRGVRQATGGLEQRLKLGMTRILCDDPALHDDVYEMVDVRYDQLLSDLGIDDGFLSETIRESDFQWLVYSLRGRGGRNVRVVCMDQQLQELLPAPFQSSHGDQPAPRPDNAA